MTNRIIILLYKNNNYINNNNIILYKNNIIILYKNNNYINTRKQDFHSKVKMIQELQKQSRFMVTVLENKYLPRPSSTPS